MRRQSTRASAAGSRGRHKSTGGRALLALAITALLGLLGASAASAAYAPGTPVSAPTPEGAFFSHGPTALAVDQASRDVYAAMPANAFEAPGEVLRFDSSGAELSCSISGPTQPSSVAVDPVSGNLYALSMYSFAGEDYDVYTYEEGCGAEVGASFASGILSTNNPDPQSVTDSAGNLYLPVGGNGNAGVGKLSVFEPGGTPLALANPIEGLTAPSAAALDFERRHLRRQRRRNVRRNLWRQAA